MALLLLGGCATQLAPNYDPTIANALSTTNSDIQALFVAVGAEPSASTFPDRKPAYDHIIAELNAILIEIKSRPTPNPDVLLAVNKILGTRGVLQVPPDPDFSSYPSARSVTDLIRALTRMEADDQQGKLDKMLVPGLEQPVNLYLMQALTYENFLKR